MAAVNKHYKDNEYNEPWDAEGNSDAAVLLRSQSRFEKMPAKRDPLTRPMIFKMCELSKEDPLGIKACVWNFVAIGTFSGYRKQEYAMESPIATKFHMHALIPNGSYFDNSRMLTIIGRVSGSRLAGIFSNLDCAWSRTAASESPSASHGSLYPLSL